jgi:spermidine synthase
MSSNIHKQDIGFTESNPEKDQIANLWYHDSVEISHGFQISIKIREVLCNYRSKWQEIIFFETETPGKMLVLDGITMLTEFDEFAYYEMLVHVPLLTHHAPSKILLIGGGDGGTVRYITKHSGVEVIHVCELDEEVVKACRKYIPSLASSFDDASMSLHKDIIRGVSSFATELYPQTRYYNTLVPTYPSGIIGFFFCFLKWDPEKISLRKEPPC